MAQAILGSVLFGLGAVEQLARAGSGRGLAQDQSLSSVRQKRNIHYSIHKQGTIILISKYS
jgi:hypothetical protein